MKRENQYQTVESIWNSLTPREKECVARICEFPVLLYSDHSLAMKISPFTFDGHIRSVRVKSGCESKLHIYAMFAPYLEYLKTKDGVED